MTSNVSDGDRHSEAGEPVLIHDPAELALAEARNALRQFDVGMEILDQWLAAEKYKLKISNLLILNRVVLEGINRYAGTFRSTPIKISGSKHEPPDPTQVPIFIEDFCEYINENSQKSAVHLAAYALWRLNWIHPFADGNGRTARIVSYMLLCARLGYRVPGTTTIPEQIAANKQPYYAALEAADRAFEKGEINVSEMESLLKEKLATQLLEVHSAATSISNDNGREKPRSLPVPRQRQSVLEADVEYIRADGAYRPVYVITLPRNELTAQGSNQSNSDKTWIERNAALVTAVATVLSAIIAASVALLIRR
ncbi:fido (protein-threonine AMPylation protein) [Afipia massiliensis]|uniref:Fido (Protein-threonine AMPylation protein) n=1 Tax=Afipia massiliensis TaxID=211460 RepID=A0A840N3J7_9BRAD|nr:Fic family protein [Afipia massiliensis]MBB5051316.1 fido (protein-threonine AMPylation protein) [Afipia massiliensis]